VTLTVWFDRNRSTQISGFSLSATFKIMLCYRVCVTVYVWQRQSIQLWRRVIQFATGCLTVSLPECPERLFSVHGLLITSWRRWIEKSLEAGEFGENQLWLTQHYKLCYCTFTGSVCHSTPMVSDTGHRDTRPVRWWFSWWADNLRCSSESESFVEERSSPSLVCCRPETTLEERSICCVRQTLSTHAAQQQHSTVRVS